MSNLKKTIVGFSTAVCLSGAMVLMPMTAAAVTVDELNTQIQALLAQITTLQTQLATLQGTPTGLTFATDLKQGSTGADVKNLQKSLNSDPATQVAANGVGSSGQETEYFGSLTKAAVVKFQDKYAADILTPLGLTAGTGYVGAATRAKLNALYGGGVVTPETPGVVTPAGTGLTLSSPVQPSATIAPGGAARLPFTKVTFTAGNDGDVVISGVNIERTGLAVDAVFAGVVLLDENGQQLGIAKTFNSDHKATVGEAFTVKAGQSRTMTIAGNMAAKATLATYAGQVAYLSVTGAVTSATVTGALPITGAGQITNGTLDIGSVTNARGPLDPNGDQSKEVGTTGYTFTSVKFTAGSVEKLRIKSIRWNQSGSAASSDLANVKTYVDGTAYDVVVSSDGKYYTSTFGDGLVADKGNSVEVYVKGDVAGGSARTISFDLYKTTDVYITGETYGYGVTPPTSGTGFAATTPWYDASVVTVSNGTLTVEKANSVAAQNVAINLANQPLGGFTVEAKGEAITVARIIFTVASTTGSGYGLLTNVSLFDENGTVVAGPVDGEYSSALAQTLTFNDTITFPIGKKTYTLKGKVATTIGTGGTYIVSFTPSTALTTVTGQVTGNTITPTPASSISLNTMTVKAAAVAISVSADPVAQSVVAGVQGHTFARYIFDATASGEDVKFSSVPLAFVFDGTATYITGCTLYDGSLALNTGSNVKNPTATGNQTFTFDSGLTILKGTTKTIALKCNIAGSATSSSYYTWGAQISTAFSATGLTSGQTATITTAAAVTGNQMAIGTGTFVVAADSSTPSYGVAASGTTGVTVGVLKFTSTNEAINLTKLGLKLTYLTTNGTASTSLGDLVQATLWDISGTDPVQVGTATFTATTSTSTLSVNFLIPKDGSKLMTIKADLANVGTSQAGQQGALIVIDYVGAGNAEGTGQSSGSTVTSTSAATAFAGVRMVRGYPTITKLSIPSTTLVTGTGVDIYRFSVKANPASGNGIGIDQFVFSVATTTNAASAANGGGVASTTVTNLKLYAFKNADFTGPVTGFANLSNQDGNGGQIVPTLAALTNPGGSNSGTSYATTTVSSIVLQIPAGNTYYFRLLGDTTIPSGSGSTGSVTIKLVGDGGYPAGIATLMGTVATVIAAENTNDAKLVWSPNATTTSATTTVDWTNGYGILSTIGLDSVTISK